MAGIIRPTFGLRLRGQHLSQINVAVFKLLFLAGGLTAILFNLP
jgi:hypothetical protein